MMTSSASTQTGNSIIRAITVSRDIMNFDLLIEDMDEILGESWGDLGFEDAINFLNQPAGTQLEFIAIALDAHDDGNLGHIANLIATANNANVKVVLIAEDVSPATLHQLLQNGADEFVPYPLPEGELAAAITRATTPPLPVPVAASHMQPVVSNSPAKDGVIMAVHGLSGGSGSTTFATNLAWELANIQKDASPAVAVLDFDLQFGSVATYLDLPRNENIYELWSDTADMDEDMFAQAFQTYNQKMSVMTAPHEVLPLDMVTPDDVTRMLIRARQRFDYIIIDMPSTLVHWSETVLNEAQVYFSMLELDMRSAQNTIRIKRALQAEDLPFEKLRFCLNRAPKFTDLSGKARVKRMSESLEIGIEVLLPDGGKPVTESNDHGQPLGLSQPKNPYRKEVHKLATQIFELGSSDTKQAA